MKEDQEEKARKDQEEKARKLLQSVRDQKEKDYDVFSIFKPIPETEGEKNLSEEDARKIMNEYKLSENFPENLEGMIVSNIQSMDSLEDAKKVVGFAEGMKKDLITEDEEEENY